MEGKPCLIPLHGWFYAIVKRSQKAKQKDKGGAYYRTTSYSKKGYLSKEKVAENRAPLENVIFIHIPFLFRVKAFT